MTSDNQCAIYRKQGTNDLWLLDGSGMHYLIGNLDKDDKETLNESTLTLCMHVKNIEDREIIIYQTQRYINEWKKHGNQIVPILWLKTTITIDLHNIDNQK